MSLVPENIKTRIDIETRVLAAALKQSFELGDNDGVSLAHRQISLLHQKSNGGGESSAAETAAVSLSHQGNIEPTGEDEVEQDSPEVDEENGDFREAAEPHAMEQSEFITPTQAPLSDPVLPGMDGWGRVARTFESYQFDENGELIKVETLPEREDAASYEPVDEDEQESVPDNPPATTLGGAEEALEVTGSAPADEEGQYEPAAPSIEYLDESAEPIEEQPSVDEEQPSVDEGQADLPHQPAVLLESEEFSPPVLSDEEGEDDTEPALSPHSPDSPDYDLPAVAEVSSTTAGPPTATPVAEELVASSHQSGAPSFEPPKVFIAPPPDYSAFGAPPSLDYQTDAFTAMQNQALSAPSFYKRETQSPAQQAPQQPQQPHQPPAELAKREVVEPQAVSQVDEHLEEQAAEEQAIEEQTEEQAVEPVVSEADGNEEVAEEIAPSAPPVVPQEAGTRNLFEQMQQFTGSSEASEPEVAGYSLDLSGQSAIDDLQPLSFEVQDLSPMSSIDEALPTKATEGTVPPAVTHDIVPTATDDLAPLNATTDTVTTVEKVETVPPAVSVPGTAQQAEPRVTPISNQSISPLVQNQAEPESTAPQAVTPAAAPPAHAVMASTVALPGAADSPTPASAATVHGAAETRSATVRSAAEAMVSEAEEALAQEMPRPENMYALLGVSQMSPQREIHKSCLCKTRKVLRNLKGKARPERDVLLKELRKLWIAHDILVDPVTRTDYDFRELGLRGSEATNIPIPEDHQSNRIGSRTPLRIGELLQCAGLLETAELEIACDMHKAMPEVQFGTFLVKQGFIQERDLDSVLMGQRLLRDGKITVAQFQVAMELSQSRGVPIAEILIEHGYLTAEQILPEEVPEERGEPPDSVPVIREVPVRPKAQELMRAELNQGKSVPTWRDQLDWSKPIDVSDDVAVGQNAEKQGLANLLRGGAPVTPNVTQSGTYPSWKDQLDWEKPEEYAEKPTPEESAEHSKPPLSWHDQFDWSTPNEYADKPGATDEESSLEMFDPVAAQDTAGTGMPTAEAHENDVSEPMLTPDMVPESRPETPPESGPTTPPPAQTTPGREEGTQTRLESTKKKQFKNRKLGKKDDDSEKEPDKKDGKEKKKKRR